MSTYIEKFGESLPLHLLSGEKPLAAIQQALNTGKPIGELDGENYII